MNSERYTVRELSEILGIEIKSVYTRIYTNKINPVANKNGVNLFLLTDFKGVDIIKYYPLKANENWFIYESKINTK